MAQQGEKKIVIITTGQPSTNPRVMKEADALLAAGHKVKVLYSYWINWAFQTDKELLSTYPNDIFVEVGGNPVTKKITFLLTRIFYKTVQRLGNVFSFLNDYALSRTSFALAKAAKKECADLYIAHNLGALPAAAKAAKKLNALYAFDAEDYHRGEYEKPAGANYMLTKRIEDKFLPGCIYITAASPLIADAYNKIVPKHNITVINNVFSKKYLQKITDVQSGDSLSIFWFSQTIGANRGLENIVEAINLLPGNKISLHLMGNCSKEYRTYLIALSKKTNSIHFLEPQPPHLIFSVAAGFDIGLAAEMPYSDNRNFCLTNKIFTYLLASNFILASDTLAQKKFMDEYNGIGSLYDHSDAKAVSVILDKLLHDRNYLNNCRKNALNLANTKLNWENESEIFLSIVRSTLNN